VRPRTLAAAAAGLLVVLLAAWAYLDLSGRRAELAGMEERLKGYGARVKTAEATVARVSYAQRWHDATPTTVACLSDLTSLIPEDGQTFLTSFTLNDELRGAFGGRSTSESNVLALLDRLGASGRFADVKASFGPGPARARWRRRRRPHRAPASRRRRGGPGRAPTGRSRGRPERWRRRRRWLAAGGGGHVRDDVQLRPPAANAGAAGATAGTVSGGATKK
jgi:hypothetical protein